MVSATRTPTAVDRIAEDWVDTIVGLDPIQGTYLGRTDHDHRLPDYSPDGHAARDEAKRAALAALRDAAPHDEVDRITVADLGSELELDLESHAAGLHLRDLNVIASPAQDIREVFDLRPAAIIRDLDLLRPIYAPTASYGHFGRELPDFTWERTDRVDELRSAAGL